MRQLRRHRYLALFFFYLVILLPFSAHLVDALCLASLTLSIIVFVFAAGPFTRTSAWLPTAIEISAIFRLCLYAPLARLILGNSGALDDWLIRPIGSIIAQDSPVGLAVGFGIFAMLQLLIIPKGVSGISEVAARFALDSLPSRSLNIEKKLARGELTNAEAAQKQTELRETTDSLGKMDGSVRFLTLEARVGVIVSALILCLGSAYAILGMGEPPVRAIAAYFELAVGANIICFTPLMLMMFATTSIVRRALPGWDT